MGSVGYFYYLYTITITNNQNKKIMQITRKSMFTGKTQTMDLAVTEEQMRKYETGRELIQNCFPDLDAGEREFIKTGVTPEEWQKTFG